MAKRQYFKSKEQLEFKYIQSNKIRRLKRQISRSELEKKLSAESRRLNSISDVAEYLANRIV